MTSSLLTVGASAIGSTPLPGWQLGPFSGGAWDSWRAAAMELVAYGLTIAVLVRSFQQDRQAAKGNRLPEVPLLAAVIGAVILTAGDELLFSHLCYPGYSPCKHAYSYSPNFLIELGHVPLWIPAAWSYVMYLAVFTSDRLVEDWRLRPLLDAFLALSIDLVVDPVATAAQNHWWTWNIPSWEQVFHVPVSNFVGWYAIVAGFSFGLRLGWRLLAKRKNGLRGEIAALLVAFAIGGAVVGFAWGWVQSGADVGKNHVLVSAVLVWIALGAIVTVRAFPFRQTERIDFFAPAVVIGLHTLLFIFVVQAGTYVDQPELMLTIPMVACLAAIAYTWPYLDEVLRWRNRRSGAG